MKTFMITAAIVAGVALGAPAMAQTKPVGADEKLVKLLQDGVIAGLVVDTGATLVTKANLSSARSQELLKPIVK